MSDWAEIRVRSSTAARLGLPPGITYRFTVLLSALQLAAMGATVWMDNGSAGIVVCVDLVLLANLTTSTLLYRSGIRYRWLAGRAGPGEDEP